MDVFFLSFKETNREKNWQILRSLCPRNRRIHGIKGLALAHQMCARLSKTPFFFVVNGDNEVLDKEFQFQLPEEPLKETVYTWRSLNPVNQLIYGFGGLKLFPKSAFYSFSSAQLDISTSLKIPYKIIPQLASITRFNASPLEAWRGAFRECVKLSSECISHQKILETKQRLDIWCEKGRDKPFGDYVLLGARQGRNYGKKHQRDKSALNKINNFDWLERFFLKNTREI